jgi:hypothetical protein
MPPFPLLHRGLQLILSVVPDAVSMTHGRPSRPSCSTAGPVQRGQQPAACTWLPDLSHRVTHCERTRQHPRHVRPAHDMPFCPMGR